MSLRLVYGRAGSGKTHFCLESIKNSLNDGGQNPIVLIVPEQFSLQAEKSLVKAASNGGIMRAEVLSFRRMAYRVFNEVGGIARRHINSAGKNMLLFRIMDRLKEQLGVFAGAAAQKGFAAEISRMIAEFKRYDITPERLKQTVSALEETGSLRYKLEDLSLIYSEFEALIRDKYLDADDDLTELYKKLDSSGRFNGAEIWIDEFSGFTPQEYKIIQKLLRKARRVNICLCTDCLETETDRNPGMVFAPVRYTASKLYRLAAQANIPVEKPVGLGRQKNGGFPAVSRFSSARELGHLEQNLYSYPSHVYTGPCRNLSIFTASNTFSEAEACAREVISLCRDGGLRYRDIAVTCRNLDSYGKILSVIFNEYGIPFFIDRKREITGHPLVVLILSALEIFTGNWSYEAVFRYVKSGLSNIGRESADRLENYALACGIRGNRWTRKELWTVRTEHGSGTGDKDSYEKRCMEEINHARDLLVEPLMVFRSKTAGRKAAAEICTALYELLLDIGAPERMEGLIQSFLTSRELEKANEYRQVWNIVMEVLNQVVEVAGEEKLSLGRFSDILSAGFEEYSIGLIPPALDQVLVGSVERSKSHEIKALFVLGVNDGVFPAAVTEEGILSDAERIHLAALGVELAKDSGYRLLEERFLAYSSLASSSSFLRLSYPAADGNGRALRPSRLLADIKRIFPDIKESSDITENKPDENQLEYVAAPGPAFNGLVSVFRRDHDGLAANGIWKDVYRWFQNNENWKERSNNILAGISYSNRAGRLDADKARRLYGSPVHTSISRLETFASCPFSYYTKYGLKAAERKIFRLEPVDVGTFMHNVLDEFSRLLVNLDISWRTLEGGWCREQVSAIVDGILQKTSGTIFNSSKRYIYLSGRLKRIVTKAVLVIAEHMKRSGFEPVDYEVEFSEGGRYPPIILELPSGDRLSLTGRIDRIDRMTNEDGTYLRIIDYKSGNKALKLSDVFYGLQLQLLTYMDAVLGDGSGEQLLPGGVLYFRLDDPIVRGGRQNSEEEIERAIMKQLKMKGLLLADVRLVKEMDRQMEGESLIIPARLNKGDVLGRSSAATMEQFRTLRNHVRKTLADLGAEMLRGNVAISPYKKRTGTACSYCDYSPVCQFDTAFGDNSYRFLADIKEEDVWRLMGGNAENTGKGGAEA